MCESCSCSKFLSTFGIVIFFINFSHSNEKVLAFFVVLSFLQYLLEHLSYVHWLFMDLLLSSAYSNLFPIFYIGLFFFLLSWKSILYILDTSSISVSIFTSIYILNPWPCIVSCLRNPIL